MFFWYKKSCHFYSHKFRAVKYHQNHKNTVSLKGLVQAVVKSPKKAIAKIKSFYLL
jgi:hypothetical protein